MGLHLAEQMPFHWLTTMTRNLRGRRPNVGQIARRFRRRDGWPEL